MTDAAANLMNLVGFPLPGHKNHCTVTIIAHVVLWTPSYLPLYFSACTSGPKSDSIVIL